MSKNKGFFVVFEGIDGSGKSTQIRILAKKLRTAGFDVVELKEPSDTVYTKEIRRLSKEERGFSDPKKIFDLFIDDRKLDVKNNIVPNFNAGKVILMDRYYYSNIAYQGAMGLDKNMIKQKNEEIAPVPDIVFIIDVSPKVAIDRILYGRNDETDNFEKIEFLEKVRSNYLEMENESNVEIINNEDITKDQLAAQVFKRVSVSPFFKRNSK